jgi:predicted regulator of Ras-like GTPase activity (Roadblock/LC7/MglB family)
MTVDPAVLAELGHLRTRLPELSASVLATADGMVVAHDARDIEPDSLAALAAAHLALARRFAHAVNHGDLRESVVECDAGYITSYAAGPNALLTLVTSGDANLAMVHHEARRCVRRLVSLLTVELPQVHTGTPASGIPTQAGPSTPLARRTPMATLPNAIRRRQAAG